MRKLILPILLLHLTMMVNAATYYFSTSSGNDSRTTSQAQNSATPWQSIAKLNAIMSSLKPGDQVLFKSGETFLGGINVTVSGTSSQPIYFGSYGSGSNPVISGFSTAANWTQVRTNVWEAPFWQPSGKESMVVMNNRQQAIGRYPNPNATNGGYLTINSNNGSTQLTSSQLPASPNWTGADIIIRKQRWILDRSTVTSQSGSTINFGAASSYAVQNNYGFFIENSTNTLDQNGEWYYDASRSRLQMYSTSNPNAYSVKASTVETLVTISFHNYLTFDNLAFEGANSYAFNLTNSNNILLTNSSINFTGIDAVKALSSGYVAITSSTISNSNNNGINLNWNCNNTYISNDTIKASAIIAGMGEGDGYTPQAIYMNGNNNLIQYCEIDSSGANGIHFEGDWSTVKNNFVNTFSFVADDCGGIYTGQGSGNTTIYNSKSILDNIVINGIGATAGTDDTTYKPANGIYLDNNTNHVTVLRNTAANCARSGMFNHTAIYSDIENNTFYNNAYTQFLAVRETNPVSNMVSTGNIMFAKTASQLASRMESYYGSNNLPGIGAVNYNYYCRPIDNNYMFYDMYELGTSGQFATSYETLTSWQSKFGIDAGSQTSPATFPSFLASNTTGVNLFANGSFTANDWNVGTWSPIGDESISWVNNKLDGGAIQLSANNYSSSNYFYNTFATSNTVTAGQGYLLSFTVQGATSGSPMSVYLKQQDAPNTPMTPVTIIPVSSTRQDYQFGFVPTLSGRVAIELDIAQPNGAVWIDNVNLQGAAITPTNPDDYTFFAYNPSTSNMQVSIPSGKYLDATGKQYNNNTVLKPFTSIVLFKTSSQTSQTAVAQQTIDLSGDLVDDPASAASAENSTATNLNWQVNNEDSNASYYAVERSSNAQTFTALGKATVKVSDNGSSNTYQYNDAAPLGGKNYYRITQFNKNGASSISKIVMVNNISFKINPNPARDVAHLTFDETISAADHLDKEIAIRNEAGVTVQTIALPSTNNLSRVDLNVSTLQRGMYVVSITSEGKAFSKKFIKQ